MSSMTKVPLRAERDVVERLARAEWWNGLVEVIWNALDAEATDVAVLVRRGGLLGDQDVEEIVVTDNGLGFTCDEAERVSASWADRGRGPRRAA